MALAYPHFEFHIPHPSRELKIFAVHTLCLCLDNGTGNVGVYCRWSRLQFCPDILGFQSRIDFDVGFHNVFLDVAKTERRLCGWVRSSRCFLSRLVWFLCRAVSAVNVSESIFVESHRRLSGFILLCFGVYVVGETEWIRL